MPSQKKLNTYGVESPCERFPGVGSFLANPGLSKTQLVPSCVVTTFIMLDVFFEILVQRLQRCHLHKYKARNYCMRIIAQWLRRCYVF